MFEIVEAQLTNQPTNRLLFNSICIQKANIFCCRMCSHETIRFNFGLRTSFLSDFFFSFLCEINLMMHVFCLTFFSTSSSSYWRQECNKKNDLHIRYTVNSCVHWSKRFVERLRIICNETKKKINEKEKEINNFISVLFVQL